MSDTPLSLVGALLLQRQARERGQRLLVEDLLAAHPHLAHADAALDLIYNEVVLREQQGETPALAEYLKRFPHLEEPLRLQFELDDALTMESAHTLPLPNAAPGDLPHLDGCEMLEELGHGAMGVVYRAWQQGARRQVAVKLLSPDVPAARVRTEAEAAARLQHPNIVQVFEVKEHRGQTALVLEFVEGGNLAQKLAGKPQPPRDAARLVEVLSGAMAYAHGRGVLHRDLKPSNVLLTGRVDGALSACIPKISDFGLAKLMDDGAGLTRTTDVLGTPSYMAPEQTGSKEGVGPPADVYSLGAVLYECLTGRPPFLGENALDTLDQARHQEPVPPRRLQPRVPPDLEIICLKCLHKAPARRYASPRELAEDLRRFLNNEPIHARPVGPAERLYKWVRRNPTAAALVFSGLLVAGLVLAGGLVLNRVLRHQRDHAREQADKLENQLQETRKLLFTAQLLRVSSLWESDPLQGLAMLEDRTACPRDLRDFTWRLLHGQCKRYRVDMAGHTRPIATVCFHPEGNVLASAGADGFIYLWNPLTGRTAGEPLKQPSAATAAAFSLDGHLLAVAGDDGRIRLWEWESRKLQGTIETPHPRVGALAFSPDKRSLASNSGAPNEAGTVILWDVAQRRVRRKLRGATNPGCGVAFSSDGSLIACGGRDRRILGWDPRTGGTRFSLKGHAGAVTSLVFAPDGRALVSGGADGTIRLWDTATGEAEDTLRVDLGPIAGLAIHPRGSTVAVAIAGGLDPFAGEVPPAVQIWDIATRRLTRSLRGHRGGVSAVAFSPDGKSIVSAGVDQHIKVWDHPGPPEQVELFRHIGVEGSVALSADGRTLAWICKEDEQDTSGRLIRVYDLEQLTYRAVLLGHTGPIHRLAISADGLTLASLAGEDGNELFVWDVRSARVLHRPEGLRGVTGLAFRSDSRSLAVCDEGSLRVLNPGTGKWRWQQHRVGRLLALAYSGDGGVLVTCGGQKGEGEVTFWSPDSGELRRRVTVGEVTSCLAVSRDGKRVAVNGGRSLVHLIGATGSEAVLPIAMKGIASLAFAADGQTLAVAGTSPGVRLWDVPSKQERASLAGHRGGAYHVAFGGRGRTMVTADASHRVHVWLSAAP